MKILLSYVKALLINNKPEKIGDIVIPLCKSEKYTIIKIEDDFRGKILHLQTLIQPEGILYRNIEKCNIQIEIPDSVLFDYVKF
jgi:hypothetical protein